MKKILILAMLLTLVGTGCKKNQNPAEPSLDPSENPSQEPSENPSEDPSQEPETIAGQWFVNGLEPGEEMYAVIDKDLSELVFYDVKHNIATSKDANSMTVLDDNIEWTGTESAGMSVYGYWFDRHTGDKDTFSYALSGDKLSLLMEGTEVMTMTRSDIFIATPDNSPIGGTYLASASDGDHIYSFLRDDVIIYNPDNTKFFGEYISVDEEKIVLSAKREFSEIGSLKQTSTTMDGVRMEISYKKDDKGKYVFEDTGVGADKIDTPLLFLFGQWIEIYNKTRFRSFTFTPDGSLLMEGADKSKKGHFGRYTWEYDYEDVYHKDIIVHFEGIYPAVWDAEAGAWIPDDSDDDDYTCDLVVTYESATSLTVTWEGAHVPVGDDWRYYDRSDY